MFPSSVVPLDYELLEGRSAVLVMYQPCPNCENLSKLFNLSVNQFPHLSSGSNK